MHVEREGMWRKGLVEAPGSLVAGNEEEKGGSVQQGTVMQSCDAELHGEKVTSRVNDLGYMRRGTIKKGRKKKSG